MARDYREIASTVQALLEKDAPDTLINKYLAAEGLTFNQFRDVLAGPTLFGQAKEFVKGIPSGLVGTLGTAVEGAAAALPESIEKPIVERTRKAVEALSPDVTPGYEDTVGRKLGEATGSIGSFFIPGTIAFKAAPLVGMSPKVAGIATGTGFGAAAGAGEARMRAEVEGATPEERAEATALGILPGLTEAAPVGRLLRFLGPAKKAVDDIPATVADKLIKRGEEVLTTAGIEGLQEWTQGLGQNMIAQGIYKPEQELLEGLGEQAAYGAGAGAIAEVFLNSILGKRGIDTRSSINDKIRAAQQEAVDKGEPQQITLALPYTPTALPNDPNVRATEVGETTLIVYPDGSTAFPSEAAAQAAQGIVPIIEEVKATLAEPAPPKAEAAAPEVKEEIPVTTITESTIKGLGVGPSNQKLREQILGKDLADPAQAAEVKTILEDYAGGKNRSARIIKNVETFLSRPEFAEPAKVEEVVAEPTIRPKKAAKAKQLPETQDVERITEPVTRTDEQSVRVPSGGETTAPGIAGIERRGVDDTVGAVRQPPVGARLVQRPLTLEEKAAQVVAERTAPKGAYNPDLLEPATELDPRQVREYKEAVGNYLEKANYIGTKALDAVAGDLHAGENSKDAKRAYRGLSEDQKEYVAKRISELETLTRRGSAWVDKYTKSQEAKKALDEELAEEAEEVPSEITGTPLQQNREFAKRLGYVTTVGGHRLKGAVNKKALDAAQAGNTKALLDALSKSRNPIYRRIAEVARNVKGLKVAVDATKIEKRFTALKSGIDSAKITIANIDALREAKRRVDAGERLSDVADSIIQFPKGLTPEVTKDHTLANTLFANNALFSNEEFYKYVAQEEKALEGYEESNRYAAGTPVEVDAIPGLYDPKENTIYLDPYFGKYEDVIAHELTHAISHDFVASPKAKGTQTYKALDNLYKHVVKQFKDKDAYGLTSLNEFVSEGLSNPLFQKELTQIKYQNTTAWTKFVQSIAKLLGLRPDNAFTELLNLTFIGAEKGQSAVRTGEGSFLLRPAGPRTEVDDDLDAMGNIANERAKTPDRTLLGKIGAFAMDPAYRQERIDAFRTQVTYKGAAAESKFKRAYNNAIRNELGELRPDLYALQAEHSDNIASQVILKGGLRIDPESGLWQAVNKEYSLADTFNIIAKLGERIGSQEKAYELANKAFIGRRAGGLRQQNERLEREAEAAEAKGDKQAAAMLRAKTIYVHASDAQIAAAEAAFKKYPELEAAFKEFTNFKNGLIDTMVESGRLTKEQAADWKSKADYVPWNRIKEYEDQIQSSPKSYFRGLVNLGQLGKLKGSDDQINNVFDNMVGLSFWMVNSSIRNHAASKMVDVLTKLDAREVTPNMPGVDPTRLIYVYKDGTPKVYELGTPADVYAFKGIESVGGPILEGFTAISNLLRKTTTSMPAFAVSQLFQDSYRAMVMSGVNSPLKIPAKVLGNFVGALRKDELGDQLASFGIVGAYDLVPNRAKDEIEKQLGIKRRGITESIMNKFESLSLASDAAQRRAVYEQTIAETGDVALALYRAQEIINFKRQGANRTVGVLRQIVPFFNAYIQGMDVLARTMAGTGLSTAERGEAIRLFVMTGIKLATLSTIYAAMVAGDDEYEGLRDYEKDKSFVIPGTGLKIPVAPEVGFMFKVIPERIYHYVMTQGTARPDDAKKTMIGVRDAFLDAFTGPALAPQALKPALEVMVNYSFFTGAPIVGRGMENKEARLQFTNSTSELAKLIGGATNTSPAKWDYLIKGYTGIAGGTALAVSDAVIAEATGQERPDRRFYELPQIRTFMYDQVPGGYKEDFYNLRDEVRRVVGTVNALKAEAKVEELQEYLSDPDKFGLYLLRSSINGIEQRLEDIRAYKKLISADPNMPGADKKDTLERFEVLENELLRTYNMPRLRSYARSIGD